MKLFRQRPKGSLAALVRGGHFADGLTGTARLPKVLSVQLTPAQVDKDIFENGAHQGR
jgi:hypothetical protein